MRCVCACAYVCKQVRVHVCAHGTLACVCIGMLVAGWLGTLGIIYPVIL